MMTLNYNEKDFQKKLQKDIEMPEIVHEHINQAYRLIENNAVLQKKASKDPYHWMKSGGRIAGGMAAVLAVGFVFCAINPVMAKNIPVVGGLFEILQDNVSFFGDFSDHATTLEAVDGTKTDSSETDGAKTDHANNDAYLPYSEVLNYLSSHLLSYKPLDYFPDLHLPPHYQLLRLSSDKLPWHLIHSLLSLEQ